MWNKLKKINGLYVVLAVACAIFFWLYVDVTVKPEISQTIYDQEVILVGADTLAESGLMLTDNSEPTVTLTFSGTRSVISQLRRNTITVSADVSQITEAGTHALDYNITYPNGVSAANVKVRRQVNTVNVSVVKMKTKTIAVRGAFEGSVADGYQCSAKNFSFDTNEITITGEEAVVDQVDHALVTLSETQLSATWEGSLPVTLIDQEGKEVVQDGLTLSRSEVNAVLPVTCVKEIKLGVTIVDGGGATADDISYTIDPSTILVSGTSEELEKLDSINIGTVDLSDVITSEKQTFVIELPDGLTNESNASVANIDLTIADNLTTTKVTTSNIQLINVPEGLSAKVVSQNLQVRIRGNAESMKLLTAGDVYAEVDLSGVDTDAEGSMLLKANVKVRGMSDVGAVGKYEVTVELGPAEDETGADSSEG